jgi:hypothetical protein
VSFRAGYSFWSGNHEIAVVYLKTFGNCRVRKWLLFLAGRNRRPPLLVGVIPTQRGFERGTGLTDADFGAKHSSEKQVNQERRNEMSCGTEWAV